MPVHFKNSRAEATPERLEGAPFGLKSTSAVNSSCQTVASRATSGPAPLSFTQERLWFLEQLDPGTAQFHLPWRLDFRGPLDLEVLKKALGCLTHRHEALRTRFASNEGQLSQSAVEDPGFQLPILEDDRGVEDGGATAQRFFLEATQKPFDLSSGQLFRAALHRKNPNEHSLLLNLHHLVGDAASLGILTRELCEAYERLRKGETYDDAPRPLQAADYAEWQRADFNTRSLDRELEFWRKQLGDSATPLCLPFDHVRPGGGSSKAGYVPVRFDREFRRRISDFGVTHRATVFMTLMAAFHAFLWRHAGQSPIFVGTPVTGRDRREFEQLVGPLTNTMVVRSDLHENTSFVELLGSVRAALLDILSRQHVPFEELVKVLQPARNLGRNPVFQTLFSLRSENPPPQIEGIEVAMTTLTAGMTPYDLSLFLADAPGGISGALNYSKNLFEETTALRMAARFRVLLQGMLDSPHRRISELEILPPEERALVINTWNATHAARDTAECLHHVVESMTRREPDRVCIQWGKFKLTRGELDQRANFIADLLASRGVGKGDCVGVCMKRTPNMPAALLGVLKSGAAYVPLDPSYPRERLTFMLEDCQAKIVLVDPCFVPFFQELKVPSVALEGSLPPPPPRAAVRISATDPAYLIYTSGSTGRPKAVLVEHRNAVNFVHWVRSAFTHDEMAGVLAGTSISFDLSIFELFGTLAAGGTILLAENVLQVMDVSVCADVTLINSVPSAMEALLARGPLPTTVRVVNLAGEPLSSSLVNRLYQHPSIQKVHDLYGPSETTTYSTFTLRKKEDEANIGRPIDNTSIYILDARQQPVPVGLPGELWIGGLGVAQGYLHRPALTEERFMDDPFAPGTGRRVYRTGDIARYMHDGRICYLGREDDQVKVRGFRVELGEVEALLSSHPSVRQAGVVVKGDEPESRCLVAWVARGSGTQPTPSELRAFARTKLPEYMVPTRIVVLDQLPLTPNGKLDRKALRKLEPAEPATDLKGAKTASNGDAGALEFRMSQIWARVLGVREFHLDDNFFDRGGHSLLALKLFAEMERDLGCTLQISALFQAPTIRQLANYIHREGWKPPWTSLVPIQPNGTRRPLFCVHAHGGHVLFYRDLATHLGPNQPLYGLQARGLEGSDQPLDSIQDMAAHYIEEMRSLQMHGPYFLAGYCSGGLIALEIARQLRAAGEQIGLLAFIETGGPGYPAYKPGTPLWLRNIYRAIQQIQIHWGSLQMLPLAGRLAYVRQRWKNALLALRVFGLSELKRAAASAGFSPKTGQHERLIATRKSMLEAILNYKPQEYPGRVVLFRASRPRYGSIPDPSLGWNQIKLGKLLIHEVPGYPGALVLEPRVGLMADSLARYLEFPDTNREGA